MPAIIPWRSTIDQESSQEVKQRRIPYEFGFDSAWMYIMERTHTQAIEKRSTAEECSMWWGFALENKNHKIDVTLNLSRLTWVYEAHHCRKLRDSWKCFLRTSLCECLCRLFVCYSLGRLNRCSGTIPAAQEFALSNERICVTSHIPPARGTSSLSSEHNRVYYCCSVLH